MAIKKPSDFFGKKEQVNDLLVVDQNDSLQEELIKVESLSEQLNQLQQEITQKVIRSDLENLVLSEITRMRENFDSLQHELRQSNEENIDEFSDTINDLTEIVNNLVEIELPNYKKTITKNEILVKEKVNQFQQIVNQNIDQIREEVQNKFGDIADVVDDNIEYFNRQLLETSSQVKKTTETYTNLSKIVENRISKENEQLEEYSNIIENIQNQFIDLQKSLNEKVSNYQSTLEEKLENYQEIFETKNQQNLDDYQKQFNTIESNVENAIDNLVETYRKDLANVKSEVVINEKHIKNVDRYLKEYHQNLLELKEEVFEEIEKLPVGNLQENLERLERKIDFIKETYSRIEPEVIIKEVISEGLLNEPPETKNEDPLTPLNQNFVTLEQLQQHYRLFLNRIQQQLSTIGGGGETRLKYLDDIVGIATNPSAYDGKFLQYNDSIGKFEFVAVSGGGESYWSSNQSGISTDSNVGIGLTNPTSKLQVVGDVNVSGVVTAPTFVGNLTGTATTAISLQNSRTFEITGDIVASPVSFDGTGNVSFAATISPNSVGLGTDTTGDYVQSISGNSNQILVTGGTGESSTPTISFAPNPTLPGNVTILNDLQVNNDLNVTGNITIGGTSAFLIVNDFRVKDKDIVLGFTTDSYGNDASNDTTANHGGISIASTEGSPLVQLYNPGIGETTPATYKKIMWFKSGSFAGLNTDAWLINYAVGIGSTQFPSGTRLAVGSVQFTERDLAVVRNVNASGIVTGSSFRSSSGYIQAADGTNAFYIYSGTGDVAFQGKINTVQINSSQGYKALDFGSTTTPSVNITNNLNVGSGVSVVGVVTASSFSGNASSATYATSSGISTYSSTSGISTNVIGGIGSLTSLVVSGVTTLGVVTTNNIYSTGIITATTFYGDGSKLSNITSGVTVRKDDVLVGTGASILNFTGYGVSTITVSSGIATVNIPATVRTTSYTVAYEGQTIFPCSYTIGYVDVFFNGAKLSPTQYSATDGANVILYEAASANDILETIGYNGVLKLSGGKTILTEVSSDGLTFYTGKAAVGIATTVASWTIRRSLFSTAGIVTSTGIARNIAWINRSTGIYT